MFMNLKETLVYFGAGVGGVFFGYWLLIATDRHILRHLEKGDMATWFAACGTILTLGFLIKQHTQLREEQKKEKQELVAERQKREAHERKQQDMWDQQLEMLTFEKFQKHKAAFHSVLDQLENSPHIKFFDREALYEELFPNNSFESCVTNKANAEFLNKLNNDYRDIWEHVKQINQSKNGVLDDKLFVDFFIKVTSLAASLKIQLQPTHEVGNLYWDMEDQQFMGNIFNPRESIHALEAVIKRISSFCYVEIPDIPSEPLVAWFLIPFYKFITSTRFNGGSSLYRTDFEEHKQVLLVLTQAYEEYMKSGWHQNCPKLAEAFQKISGLIFDAPKLIKLFSSIDEVRALVAQLDEGVDEHLNKATHPINSIGELKQALLSLHI